MLAQSGDGRTLARAIVDAAGRAPSRRRGRSCCRPSCATGSRRLVLEGPPSAGSVVLLDERWRRRPVGLLAGDLTTADTPFTGPLYYLRRALAPYTEVREGDLPTLLQRELSVLVLADRPLPAGPERDAHDRVGARRAACWSASPARARPSSRSARPIRCCR